MRVSGGVDYGVRRVRLLSVGAMLVALAWPGVASAEDLGITTLVGPLAVLRGSAPAPLFASYGGQGSPQQPIETSAILNGAPRLVRAIPRSAEVPGLADDAVTAAVIASVCPGGERSEPRCYLARYQRSGLFSTGMGQRIGDTPSEAADRLPSAWGGNVAFVRETAAAEPQLRLLAPASTASVGLRGGPATGGGQGPTGLALRGHRLAYAWAWGPTTDRRAGVFLTTTSGSSRRVVMRTTGTIVGPRWIGSRLLFAIRSGQAARWYLYDPAHRRIASRRAPAGLAAFVVAGSQMFFERSPTRVGTAGFCQAGSCHIYRSPAPRF